MGMFKKKVKMAKASLEVLDCDHPEQDRRYDLREGLYHCRKCAREVQFKETQEQQIARERRAYLVRPHTPK